MNLQIRDPRAHRLASELAAKRKRSMTDVVIEALEAELKRQREELPLSQRIGVVVDNLHKKAKPGGRDLTR